HDDERTRIPANRCGGGRHSALRGARQARRRAGQESRARLAALAPSLSTRSEIMSATTLSASFGGIAGSDLEAELAQARTVDHDAHEAADREYADAAHHHQA